MVAGWVGWGVVFRVLFFWMLDVRWVGGWVEGGGFGVRGFW